MNDFVLPVTRYAMSGDVNIDTKSSVMDPSCLISTVTGIKGTG
jgi:hypothetical protein